MASSESPDSVVYDFCVVGSGLFGSSCAKYAAEDGPTILIGPSEEAKLKVGGVTSRHLASPASLGGTWRHLLALGSTW